VNEGTAIEVAKSKMKELGVGENYIIRYRHLRLDSQEKRRIKGENHLYILIQPTYWIKVKSKAGIYNMSDNGINELQHIHRGLIEVENPSRRRLDAKFIQVIPLQKKLDKEVELKQA